MLAKELSYVHTVAEGLGSGSRDHDNRPTTSRLIVAFFHDQAGGGHDLPSSTHAPEQPLPS
jgi:hypothetical protein